AMICGGGTSYIEIVGVKELHDTTYTLMPDRIVAGTYMTAIAATYGDGIFTDFPTKELETVVQVLRKIGCKIEDLGDGVRISCSSRLESIKLLKTQPYPGFPTDMQSQMMTVLSLAKGVSTIAEEIFESRFQNAYELGKMGANIIISAEDNRAIIAGVEELHGAVVKSHDLRGGAALVIAGLCAKGTTIIQEATSIERGYEDICRDFSELGADIKYCSENAS
ncbi:MAG TPA: UDP-N-acetylglucosamine 1-carboxyvinyltransferase, partial [Clostridiales bacterium]|nr:UDP-N-acetylglucosamine 1-carboxyvinyltransferase [Clostridiales bacterium]